MDNAEEVVLFIDALVKKYGLTAVLMAVNVKVLKMMQNKEAVS